jgi:hypothetical protein
MQNTFIGYKPTPVEAVKNISFGPFYKAGLIGIFYSQDEIALMLFGKLIVV